MKNSRETLDKTNALRRMWKETIDPNSFPHQILRVCKDCGEVKLCDWLSSFTRTGKPEYKARCRDCAHKLNAIRRKKRWDYIKAKKIELRKTVKQKCIEYLGGKCSICGYAKSQRALTFHHIDRTTKDYEISVMVVNNCWEKIKQELEKCILVCFNCHMELEENYEDAVATTDVHLQERLHEASCSNMDA